MEIIVHSKTKPYFSKGYPCLLLLKLKLENYLVPKLIFGNKTETQNKLIKID